MKKLVVGLLSIFIISQTVSKADEGMWIPMLLKQLNESDMQAKGLKLTAEDIYSINKSSLKDAIVHFGGGCTAEIISDKGLLLTNHHCGYGRIQAHSSVENDLLTHGFWAMNASQELSNPGLTATIIVRMEDVTSKVLAAVTDNMNDSEREKKIAETIKVITAEAIKGTHYEAYIRPFYYGNEFYMFIVETFRDVRLVGAPPSSIGKYGGDTDNWMWPRHTGDFSVFRIYANKENLPADYSKDNVPYKPKYTIPITLKGLEENEFTMVYGFPGRTTEYLTSYAVNIIMHETDPERVKIRDTRLSIMAADMKTSDKIRIQYSAKHAGVANAYKKWQGEIRGLKKLDAVNKKKLFEEEFLTQVNTNDDAKAKYGTLFSDFEKAYLKYSGLNKQYDYFTEAVLGIEAVSLASSFKKIVEDYTAGTKEEDLKTEVEKLKGRVKSFFKDYNAPTDQKICAALLKMYSDDISKNQQPDIFQEIEKKYKNDFVKYASTIYSKSVFSSEESMNKMLDKMGSNYKKIEKDPIFMLMKSCYDKFLKDVRPEYVAVNDEIERLNRTYMKAMKELVTTKKYYPDANSTLRVAYGKAEGYYPRDGVFYKYYSTLDGLMAKEDPNNDEFVVPSKLKELYLKKDYGQYADKNGELRVTFCASNHTTGGNSGSPVFNGRGELVGTNFDRNWEGTMSDVMFDPNQVRNIVLDVRYTLFVIDKFAGAGYLLDEMKIIK